MNKKREIIDISFGFLGTMLMAFALNLFNKYVLMSIPLVIRMVLMIVLYWFIALIPVVIMMIRKDKLNEYGFTRTKIPRQLLIGLSTGVAFSIAFTLIPNLIGLGDWVSSGKGYKYLWQFLYQFIYCILAVGLTEEFIFRGFLYKKIEKISTPTIAVILSSIMFGFLHIFSGNIIQLIVTALLGVLFCLCKIKFKYFSMLSLIIAHGVYDALIAVTTYAFSR